MPKSKHRPPKGGKQVLPQFLRNVGEEVEHFHDFVADRLDGLSDELGLDGDSMWDNFTHQTEGLFTRLKRGVGDAMRGEEAGPAEQVLRKLQDCAREVQHACKGIARKADHEFGHLGGDAPHKIHGVVDKIQSFFSKLVEKIGHAINELRQGISSMFGSPGKHGHDARHYSDAPHPELASSHSHKKHRPRPGKDE